LRELVADNELGWSVDWDVTAVAGAMHEALSSEPSTAERQRIAKWTDTNYSLQAVAARAVARIGDAISIDEMPSPTTDPSSETHA
jgi:hypothetical protein